MLEQKAWVDFNLVKATVTMEMLVVQYGITGLARNGDELRGVCPIHQGKSKREFSVNLTKNTFICFAPTCKARGNVLDFVAKMERCTVKEAALKIDEWFTVTEQARGESESAPVNGSTDAAALIVDAETHIAEALRHATLAADKITALKHLFTAR